MASKPEHTLGDQGRKMDAGKAPMELLSSIALFATAEILAIGAKKYSPDGWRKGIEWRRVIGACYRHLAAFADGEDLDPESGKPHIDHLACEVMFLQEFVRTRKDLDDRYRQAPPAVEKFCTYANPCVTCEPAKAAILPDAPSHWLEHGPRDLYGSGNVVAVSSK